jgi:pimeloyl-ACP methyl ester carboxylesterase
MVSNPAPTASALRAKAATLVFAPELASLDLSYMNAWNGYPRDEHVGKWIEKDVPWLMMQGTFDFQTVYSLSQRALEHVKDPALQFVRVDGGGHGVVFDSKCSVGILEGFLANPRAKVDSSCMKDVTRDALELDSMYVQYFFGTADAWD